VAKKKKKAARGDAFCGSWPEDRYEVRCVLPTPDFVWHDRYHFARNAQEAARRRRDAGLVVNIQVVRLSDDAVLFDLEKGAELLLEAW
jgi:hypothetical protein